MIRGMCEYYRPGPTIDFDHDQKSRAKSPKVECILLSLWGVKGKIDQWYQPLSVWQEYCTNEITGCPINSGHYLAEEAPQEVLEQFYNFFR